MSPRNKNSGDDSWNCKKPQVGRYLEWGALNSSFFFFWGGGGVGVLVFWDNRVLQMEGGKYSVSCRFKKCEDGFCWIFFRSVWTHCESGERRFFE